MPRSQKSLERMIRQAVLLALGPAAACGGDPAAMSGSMPRAGRDAISVDAGMAPEEVDAEPCAPRWLGNTRILWPCGAPELSPHDHRSSFDRCADVCGGRLQYNSCSALPNDADAGDSKAQTILCYRDGTGRRPAGLIESASDPVASAAELLARAAFLEAASVDAFLQLATELARFAAPRKLLRRLRKAAADEVRHADTVGAAARRFGASVHAVRVNAPEGRSLLEIALENAREGCVRETYGVACALWQSQCAQDDALRSLMGSLALDELAHAQLSWDLAAWMNERLAPPERDLVLAERERAVRQLERDVQRELPQLARAPLGLPSSAEAAQLVAGLKLGVWADA